jgi:hypothetical protein
MCIIGFCLFVGCLNFFQSVHCWVLFGIPYVYFYICIWLQLIDFMIKIIVLFPDYFF